MTNLNTWLQNAVATKHLASLPATEFGERVYLSRGSFGKIFTSTHLWTNEKVVMKKVKKAHVEGKDAKDALIKEVKCHFECSVLYRYSGANPYLFSNMVD